MKYIKQNFGIFLTDDMRWVYFFSKKTLVLKIKYRSIIELTFIQFIPFRAWILDVMLIALVSKVTLLEWLSKFAQCWVPRESVLRGSGAHKATSTAQNLKVTLIEWHLKLTLLALHQVFTPYVHQKYEAIVLIQGIKTLPFPITSITHSDM